VKLLVNFRKIDARMSHWINILTNVQSYLNMLSISQNLLIKQQNR